jgi:Glucodextranase, domain B
VLSSHKRLATWLSALTLTLMCCTASTASAAVSASRITSPSDPTYALAEFALGSGTTLFTVRGTTEGTGNVDLRCFGSASATTLATNVTVTANSFSVPVTIEELPITACVLRAVPTGDSTLYPPASTSPFTGIRLGGTSFEEFTNSTTKGAYDYEVEANTLGGHLDIESAGDCGLDYSSLFAPFSLEESSKFFDCNAELYTSNEAGFTQRLQVDGASAYTPATAQYLQESLKVQIPGAPLLSVSQSFDPATGLVTIHETDPIAKCSPQTTTPATTTSCTSFVSTGVELERTWLAGDANELLQMSDKWHSTDGAAHSFEARYQQYFVSEQKNGAYQFPGASGFSATTTGESIGLPQEQGMILYKENAETSAAGDGVHPQGAILYDSGPSEAVHVGVGSTASDNEFEMAYQRSIPAGGSYTVRMAFVQAYSLAEVTALAEPVLASYAPSLAITSPAGGATVTTPSVTVAGTASDSVGVTSLTVAGKAVAVEGGAWSTSVPLSVGANTITATVTNQAGVTKSASVSVTYLPPLPSPPPPPVAHASQVGAASGANGKVTLALACTGAAGTVCHVHVALTSVEKLHGGRVIAVVAKAKARAKTVVIASVNVTIAAGARVKLAVSLNATGRKLLAHFGKLPAHLSAVLIGTPSTTIVAQNLTIKPAAKRHGKHKH